METLYAWPHLNYRIDITVPAKTQFLSFDATMPFENVLGLWRNDNPTNQQAWLPLKYGFEDWINETQISWPTIGWRNVVKVDSVSGLTNVSGQAQLWPIPSQAQSMRWNGQAPLNPLKADTDKCIIDSTAIVLTAAAELLGAQKSEVASLKGNKAQAYIRRLIGRSGANKRDISAMGQGRTAQATLYERCDPLPRLHSGAVSVGLSNHRFQGGAGSSQVLCDRPRRIAPHPTQLLRQRRGGDREAHRVPSLGLSAEQQSGVLSRNGEFFVVAAGASGITDWIPTNPGLGTATPGIISLAVACQRRPCAGWRTGICSTVSSTS